MMRTGIFGGSFNPIHLGHTRLAEALTGLGMVDELWLMVSPLNPLKRGDDSLLPDEVRLSLARLAVGESQRVRVSDFEMRLPRPSYMAHTLAALVRAHPGREFTLVIGADNWLSFALWRDAGEILAHHRVIVYPRPGHELQATSLPQGVTLAPTPLIDLSATDIRRRIARGGYGGEGLHPNVWQEIQKKGYYK